MIYRASSFLALSLLTLTNFAFAAPTKFICSNNSSGQISIKKRCASGETRIQFRSSLVGPQGAAGSTGATGAQGPTGATGPAGTNGTNGSNGTNGTNGVDGVIRIYGDGSDGDVTLGTETYFPLRQYDDITVSNGETLTVESGTVIRCTGTFTNNGTINVTTHAEGGVIVDSSAGTIDVSQGHPSPGLAQRPAFNGESNDGSTPTVNSLGGTAVSSNKAVAILKPGPLAGGAGGGGLSSPGGDGGGAITILCKNGINNTISGTIQADGGEAGTGGGGGAGGLIVLASETSIANAGVLRARGRDGGNSSANAGPGGGGGGGIINLLAPTISNPGTLSVAGGLGGSGTSSVSNTPRSSGGGGGAFGGNGGNSGLVAADGSSSSGSDGLTGQTFQNLIDPSSLVM